MKIFFDLKVLDLDNINDDCDIYDLFGDLFGEDATENEVLETCSSVRIQFYDNDEKYAVTDELGDNFLETLETLNEMDSQEYDLFIQLWLDNEGVFNTLVWQIYEGEYTIIDDIDDFVREYLTENCYTKDAEEMVNKLLPFIDCEDYFNRELIHEGNFVTVFDTLYQLHW